MNKDFLKNLLGDNPTILEIGCANGEDTKWLMDIGTVYAFEPEPKNIAILKKIQGFSLFEGAVSDVDGHVFFHRSSTDDPEALSLSGSIMPPKNHLKIWQWIYFNDKISVPSVRLDTYCASIPSIDFIWCDAQGAEEKIIKGGLKTLDRTKFFYTEYSNDEQYEGQPTLERIKSFLPNFTLIHDFGTDALFQHI